MPKHQTRAITTIIAFMSLSCFGCNKPSSPAEASFAQDTLQAGETAYSCPSVNSISVTGCIDIAGPADLRYLNSICDATAVSNGLQWSGRSSKAGISRPTGVQLCCGQGCADGGCYLICNYDPVDAYVGIYGVPKVANCRLDGKGYGQQDITADCSGENCRFICKQ
jgi:hypothetical protein